MPLNIKPAVNQRENSENFLNSVQYKSMIDRIKTAWKLYYRRAKTCKKRKNKINSNGGQCISVTSVLHVKTEILTSKVI